MWTQFLALQNAISTMVVSPQTTIKPPSNHHQTTIKPRSNHGQTTIVVSMWTSPKMHNQQLQQ
jgi:hypothetical protein